MPTQCSICARPDRARVDAELRVVTHRGGQNAVIKRYDLSPMSVSRHRRACLGLPSLSTRLPYDRVTIAPAERFLATLPARCVDVCVTSPPYLWKGAYSGAADELGQEPEPEVYLAHLRTIMRQVARVLRPSGWLFLNIGDTYANHPGGYRGNPDRAQRISAKARRWGASASAARTFDVSLKSQQLIPERLAVQLVMEDGWIKRNTLAWVKTNAQPANVSDRFAEAWEPVLCLTRSQRPYFDRRPNDRDVLVTAAGRGGRAGEHPAPFPDALPAYFLSRACPPGGVVLDPFAGSGTTLDVCRVRGLRFLGCDLRAWDAEAAAVAS